MKTLQRAYSLVEVLIAAAIVAIGVSAAAVLVGGIMTQEQASAGFLRGINLQEQAVRLWQMGLEADLILAILPEECVSGSTPAPGTFAMSFTAPAQQTFTVATSGGPVDISVQMTTNTITYASLPAPAGETQSYVTHEFIAVRPDIR